MTKKPVVATQLRTSQETLDTLDKFAEKMQLSRNQLMCNLIAIGLEDLSMFNKLGLLRVGIGIRNLIDAARNESSHTQPQTR